MTTHADDLREREEDGFMDEFRKQVKEHEESKEVASRKLPEGKTCADCFHIKHCSGLGYSWPGRDRCDFLPSRFRDASPKHIVLNDPESFKKLKLECGPVWHNEFSLEIDGKTIQEITKLMITVEAGKCTEVRIEKLK